MQREKWVCGYKQVWRINFLWSPTLSAWLQVGKIIPDRWNPQSNFLLVLKVHVMQKKIFILVSIHKVIGNCMHFLYGEYYMHVQMVSTRLGEQPGNEASAAGSNVCTMWKSRVCRQLHCTYRVVACPEPWTPSTARWGFSDFWYYQWCTLQT